MPDYLKENDKFPEPIITTTKADNGEHDADISREDILSKGIVSGRRLPCFRKHKRFVSKRN
jgi:phosphoribosylaminoimidazole-succinocarboxamide synthase